MRYQEKKRTPERAERAGFTWNSTWRFSLFVVVSIAVADGLVFRTTNPPKSYNVKVIESIFDEFLHSRNVLGTSSRKDHLWDNRKEEVKEAFMTSWDAYEKYAWGAF